MMSITADLVEHMRKECALLIEFHDAETAMKARVHEKDWDGLQAIIEALTSLADELVETENSRHLAFETLKRFVGENEAASFYQVIVHLGAEERDALAELYRTLTDHYGLEQVTVATDYSFATAREAADTMRDGA